MAHLHAGWGGVGLGWGGWGAMLTFTITFGNQGWHISTGGVGVGWVGCNVDVHIRSL